MTDTAVELPEQPEAPAAEAKPAKAPKVATPCACRAFSGKNAQGETLSTGCEGETVRTFMPGHDAKLKSMLIKIAVAGNQVTKTAEDGSTTEIDPLHAAEEFGFRTLVEKSVDTAKAKQAAKDEKAQAREAARQERAAKKAEAKAAREQAAQRKKAHAEAVAKAAEERKTQPGPAKAKVGNKVVEGEILNDGQFKYTKGDTEVETNNYTPVIDPATVPVPEVAANVDASN